MDVKKFKAQNKSFFIKNNVLHSRIKIKSSLKQFLEEYFKNNKEKMRSMGISSATIN